MKKFILVGVLALTLVASASAEAHWRGGYGYRGGWIAPALIGGVVGYELAQPRYYAPPPVYYTPPPSVVYVQPQIAPQTPPAGYHWQEILDPQTGTQKLALVPN